VKRLLLATASLYAPLLVAPVVASIARPLFAQQPPTETEQEPPEEDEALRPKEYTFNPLQAEKEMKIGAFYFKKGSFKAAMLRFEEATKWNPALAEAWMHLGEAREKMKDAPGAAAAYKKYVELAPDSKQAVNIKKKLAGLPK
jgi:tetratricopeptide (TPR) repeat protein